MPQMLYKDQPFVIMFVCVCVYILREFYYTAPNGLTDTKQPMLALNMWQSSCLSLVSTETAYIHHYA